MIKTIVSLVVASLITGSAFAALPVDTITDADIVTGDRVHFSADTTYILKGMVVVDSGAVLTIEPGTVIKAYQDPSASMPTMLLIARGARIYAEGTRAKPIIFTWYQDDPANPYDAFEQLDYTVRGLWGGVMLCGRASVNTVDGYFTMEGIPSTETRAVCGGGAASDDNDTSGVLTYVSIRYGGYILKEGSEVNGLTLGAVGRGTKIDYVEVYNNSDDGFEVFGGTVNLSHLVSAFNGDDAFDYDEGWMGRAQYLFGIFRGDFESGNTGDCGGENDGGGNQNKTWISNPVMSNTTYIGCGVSQGMNFKEQSGGNCYNFIISGFETGLRIDADAVAQFNSGLIILKNGIMKTQASNPNNNFVHPNTVGAIPSIVDMLKNNWNVKDIDPLFKNKYIQGFPPAVPVESRSQCQFDYMPKAGSPAVLDTFYYGAFLKDSLKFIEPTAYMGAFDPRQDTSWIRGWTAIDHYGFVLHNDLRSVNTQARNPTFANKLTTHLSKNVHIMKIRNVNNNVDVAFNLANMGNVILDIYNMHGQKVSTVYSGQRSAGYNLIKFDAHTYVNGQYMVRLSVNGKIISSRLTIVR